MRTKIIATIGPASADRTVLKQLIKSGMDVCRLNFSHGTHEEHGKLIQTIKELNIEMNSNIAILADLQGPKIRLGDIENGEVMLHQGMKLLFTSKPCLGTKEKMYVSYSKLAQDVRPGEHLLIDDGKICVRVVQSDGVENIEVEVIEGGPVRPKKGVNMPNTLLSLPSMTDKDRHDLAFILTQDVHWIALSFVRKAKDIIDLKQLMKNANPDRMPWVMAKIEKPEAINDIDKIIEVSEGIMVARGDLGVEIPLQKVPMLQKKLIKKCIQAGKPIVVATQMLEGMINSSRPTRAEASDVANSVMDGADTLMLSGETSVGEHPVEAVVTMNRIIEDVESFQSIYYKHNKPEHPESERYLSEAIIFDACKLARQINAKVLFPITHSGFSALKMASHRPEARIFALTYDRYLLQQLSLVWGITGLLIEGDIKTSVEIVNNTIDQLKQKNIVKDGDLLINTASMPFYVKGKTNSLKVTVVGEE